MVKVNYFFLLTYQLGNVMTDLIAYKSNALVEASYKLTLQEQRLLLLCISRLNSSNATPESQKTMMITAEDFFNSFLENCFSCSY